MNFGVDCISVFEAQDIERYLPTEVVAKGVYAWYLPVPEVRSNNKFSLYEYQSFYQKFWEKTWEDGQSKRCRIRVSSFLPPPSHHEIDQAVQKHWENQLAVIAQFAPPIYIGKAAREQGGLTARLLEHRRNGSFEQQVVKLLGHDPRFNRHRFIIKTFNMTKFYASANLTSDQLDCLIEEMELMLLWQHQPIFNTKRGN